MAQARDTRRYEELDVIEIPSDVPEIGVRAGERGTIVDMSGDTLTVEVVAPSGKTRGIIDMVLNPHPRVVGTWDSPHR
jgi:hypothetical protein